MGFAPALAIMGIAGAATSAYGAYSSSQAQSANAAYQAQVAQNNAAIAQRNAVMDIQAGEVQATNAGLKGRAQVGQERAQLGAGGIDPNTGSAASAISGTEALTGLNAMTSRSNAAKAAYGQQVQATSDTAQSGLLSAESSQYAEAAPIGAAGTLLSGVSTAGSNYLKFSNPGGSSGGNIDANGNAIG